jgi:acyl-[acyl-carrier-protein] desaturase
MPGYTIENFGRKSVQIAMAGIYDLRIHHDEVLTPVLRQLRTFDRTDLNAQGEHSREELSTFLHGLDAAACRFVDKRDTARAKAAARA